MRVIQSGVTRTVILTRRYAIKLPSLRPYGDGLAGLLWSICRGILANQSEQQWWTTAPDDMRQYLCPVLRSWFGAVVNVYPRCEPFEADEATAEKMFTREWTPVELLFPHPGDNKPDNYGWLNGRLVCLDYDMNYNGCPHDRSGARNRAEEPVEA